MAGLKLFIAVLLLGASVIIGGTRVGAQVHHVVGGDGGWSPTSDLVSWSSGRDFRVGDKIWFINSAGQGRIVELESIEEYTSCNISNPIKMYTDGLDHNIVSLDGEGIRYFASSDPESCKNGLKLHVEVKPSETTIKQSLPLPPPSRLPLPPPSPSRSLPPPSPSRSLPPPSPPYEPSMGSSHMSLSLSGICYPLFVLLLLSYVGL